MKVSILGVLIGGVVDVTSSIVFGSPFGLYAMLELNPSQRVGPHASEAITAALRASPFLYGGQLLVGMLCSVLGGFVAAVIAKRHERLNGTLSSYLCVALGVATFTFHTLKDPIWLQTLLLLASPLCAFIGGDLRFRQMESRTARLAG